MPKLVLSPPGVGPDCQRSRLRGRANLATRAAPRKARWVVFLALRLRVVPWAFHRGRIFSQARPRLGIRVKYFGDYPPVDYHLNLR